MLHLKENQLILKPNLEQILTNNLHCLKVNFSLIYGKLNHIQIDTIGTN